MKLIRKLTPMMNLTFQIVIHLSDRKCRHLRPKHVDVHLEIKEIHTALLTKLKSSSIAETTLWNFPRLNSIWYWILGMIHWAINCDRVSNAGRVEKMRQRTRMPFLLHSHRICLKTFLFMHRLHKTRFYSRVKHNRVSGLSLRTHGNKSWRLPSSAFSAETIKRVVKFIMNVAEDQAFLLPGRVPGLKRTDKKLLPTSMTKSRLWKRCVETGKASVQCHISTSPTSTADVSVQNDHYDVTTELRKQILNWSS